MCLVAFFGTGHEREWFRVDVFLVADVGAGTGSVAGSVADMFLVAYIGAGAGVVLGFVGICGVCDSAESVLYCAQHQCIMFELIKSVITQSYILY